MKRQQTISNLTFSSLCSFLQYIQFNKIKALVVFFSDNALILDNKTLFTNYHLRYFLACFFINVIDKSESISTLLDHTKKYDFYILLKIS
jgi:hypothetical protein